MLNELRLEISFKDIPDLKKRLDFCIKNNFRKINIPCKGFIKKDFLKEVVDFIGINYKNIDVIYHYSLHHQYTKNKIVSYENLLKFIEKSNKYNNNELLLISGSKKREGFESSNVIHKLKNDLTTKSNFGVAFNPYFYDKNKMNKERDKLLEKLDSGLINSIWLQFGSNMNSLIKETDYLKTNILNYSNEYDRKIKIYGSIFIPSKKFLAQFKFRPWKEVFLSLKYLNSFEYANQITKDILSFYSNNEIFPLIESDCSSFKKLNELKRFLFI